MSSSDLEDFLTGSPVAKRARAAARLVVRRFEATSDRIDAALDTGRVAVEATPVCELVVGERMVARGEIISEAGTNWFRVTEVME